MKKHTYNLLSYIAVFVVGLLANTNLRANQQQLAASMKEVSAEVTRTHEQLASTLSALNALTKQTKGDLRPAYDAFAAEIPKTEAAAETTRTRVKWMNGDGQKYFDDWQSDVNSIANESLRKKAQKRLDAVKESYVKVLSELKDGAAKFQPFLSDLKDIQKTLENDVTQAGVKAARSTVSSANWNYKSVNRSIIDCLDELRTMQKSLSPEVK